MNKKTKLKIIITLLIMTTIFLVIGLLYKSFAWWMFPGGYGFHPDGEDKHKDSCIGSYMNIHDDIELNEKKIFNELNEDKKELIGVEVDYPWTSYDNDYFEYVKVYPRIWCLSEKQTNVTWYNAGIMELQAIIEIGDASNPVSSKVYYKKGVNSELTGYEKDIKYNLSVSEKDAAQSVFVMKNGATDHITYVAQTFFFDPFEKDFVGNLKYIQDGYDTKNYYDGKGLERVNTETYNGVKYSYTSYADAITNINRTPINTNNYQGVKYSIGNYELNGNTYTTVIERDSSLSGTGIGIDVSSNSTLVTSRKLYLTLKDSVVKEYDICIETTGNRYNKTTRWILKQGNTIKGEIVKESGSIYLTDSLEVTNIEIKIEYDYIHGTCYYLNGSSTQTRAVTLGKWEHAEVSSSVSVESEYNNSVSLQKYIIKVNDNTLKDSQTSLKDRSNTYTRRNGETSINALKKVSFQSGEVNNQYKYDNIVLIKEGDIVTYEICVYNNTNHEITNVVLKDQLPYYTTSSGVIATAVENIEVFDGETKVADSKLSKIKIQNKYDALEYTIDSLAGNETKIFTIKMQFNTYIKGILTNSASVICDENNLEYRTIDRDYVKILSNKIEISLKKYVTTVSVAYTDADGKESWKHYNVFPNGTSELYTDENGDGVWNSQDQSAFAGYQSGKNFSIFEKIGDLNGDGVINTEDLRIGRLAMVYNNLREDFHHNPDITSNSQKSRCPVIVNTNNKVTFNIGVKNTSENNILVKKIKDTWSDGMELLVSESNLNGFDINPAPENIEKEDGTEELISNERRNLFSIK